MPDELVIEIDGMSSFCIYEDAKQYGIDRQEYIETLGFKFL